jgi:hypothetical protein
MSQSPGAELQNGLVFCQIKSWLTGRRLVSVPFSDHSQPLVDYAHSLDEIMTFLDDEQDRRGWKYVELRPHREIGEAAPSCLKVSRRFVFHRLDLRPSLDVLMRQFHEKAVRQMIRRAAREQVTSEAGRSDELLNKFYALLVMACRKKLLPPQPLEWFQNLSGCLGDRLTIRVASKNSSPIAGILTVAFKGSTVYKYACSDPRFSPLGGNILLLWESIQDAKKDGFVELDFGRSAEDHHGLLTFKDRWGTTRTQSSYLRGPARTAPRTAGDATLDGWLHVAQRVFPFMPDKCLVAAGRVLYRHVG